MTTDDSSQDTDLSITPTNTPKTPPIDIPTKKIDPDNMFESNSSYEKPDLSPISGSFEFDYPSDDSFVAGKMENSSGSRSLVENFIKSRPPSATNELPLTQLNLALFTSNMQNKNSLILSTNELPLSELRFNKDKLSRQNTNDSQNDNLSIEANWDTDIKTVDDKSSRTKETRHRSFSDPNILDLDHSHDWINCLDKNFLLEKYKNSLMREQDVLDCNKLSPPVDSVPHYPNSFYPEHASNTTCPLCAPRTPSTLLSFFTSSSSPLNKRPVTTSRSLSHPSPPCMCYSMYAECGQIIATKRHRHSIAGQMSYFKMLGFGCGGPVGLKKLVTGSANSLFSTAVISGSSSAPNLRDMISNTTSATGKIYFSHI